MQSKNGGEEIGEIVKSLARIHNIALVNDTRSISFYVFKLQQFDPALVDTVAQSQDWKGMPTPAELRFAVLEYRNRMEQEHLYLPAGNAQEWVCPACKNTGWAMVYQFGQPAARRCLRGDGYHSLFERIDELEMQSRADLVNWLTDYAKRDPEQFDEWVFQRTGATYLSGLTVKQLWELRIAVERGAVLAYTNSGEIQ